ncbi:transmembrane protein, putative [Medicago truncatula]|uniref:Transmembrane protein, putative n=1 Tax=Medicago truncatula TaxID=3880 RepID=G7JNT3_MEDTR|nr:transmembrane protein, putative [Medicago truncatula]
MAYAAMRPIKPGLKESQEQIHKIRIIRWEEDEEKELDLIKKKCQEGDLILRSSSWLRWCLVLFAMISALMVCGPALCWRFKNGITLNSKLHNLIYVWH